MTSPINTITIRRANGDDEAALAALSALDSAKPLTGDVLVADVGGEAWAAIELTSERAIADPFRPTADLVELLRLRSTRIRGERRNGRRRVARLRLRSAAEPA
jgi:hypothetical protein